MFGVSYTEAIVLFVVLFVVFKPSDIVSFARNVKDFIAKMHDFSNSIKQEFTKNAILDEDFKEAEQDEETKV